MASDSTRPARRWGLRSRRKVLPYVSTGLLQLGRGRFAIDTDALHRAAVADGTRHGAVRSPADTITRDDSATHRFIDGSSKARQGQTKVEAHHASRDANARYATAEARKEGKKAEQRLIKVRILGKHAERHEATLVLHTRETELNKAKVSRAELSAAEKGHVGLPTVLACETFVAAFDGAVIHDALERSGTTPTTVWLTSFGVPLLIGACNHGFGVLAGVIGRATPKERRLSLALTAFGVGITALVATFATLMIFRALAGDQLNAALNALAAGGSVGNLRFTVPMYWLGPAQLAGSIAAISLVALWTMGKPGREARKAIIESRNARHDARNEVLRIDSEIDALVEDYKSAELAICEIDADQAAAHSELVVTQRTLNSDLESEEGIRQALKARADIEFQITSKLHQNGGVWLAAIATIKNALGRQHTPKPQFTSASGDPSHNGHKPGPDPALFN